MTKSELIELMQKSGEFDEYLDEESGLYYYELYTTRYAFENGKVRSEQKITNDDGDYVWDDWCIDHWTYEEFFESVWFRR